MTLGDLRGVVLPDHLLLPAVAAPCSLANPRSDVCARSARNGRRIQQKREPAKDKRRNEAREFGLNGVRPQCANHQCDQDSCGGSSPPGNQHTEASEDFERYRLIEPVTTRPDARPANEPRHWSHRLLPYAVVAIMSAILAILFAQTRYDKFVPSHRSQISPTVPGR